AKLHLPGLDIPFGMVGIILDSADAVGIKAGVAGLQGVPGTAAVAPDVGGGALIEKIKDVSEERKTLLAEPEGLEETKVGGIDRRLAGAVFRKAAERAAAGGDPGRKGRRVGGAGPVF